MANDYFTIIQPSDMHCHFRQGEVLKAVVPVSAEQFAYVVAMPNTKPPITMPFPAMDYIKEILAAAGGENSPPAFKPLGIAYLTDDISLIALRAGFEQKAWYAAKLYPANATTNSDSGITSQEALYAILEVMEEIGMPLLVHGEMVGTVGSELARWQREKAFVEYVLPKILRDFPKLIVVLEHISTKTAADFVWTDESGRLFATITPHHLLFTDADVSKGGVWTDANCMPIIKTAEDRQRLRIAATSGDSRFFAGTDSAPHDTESKYCNCCSFGAFVAPGAIEAYAAVFEQEKIFDRSNGVERFEKFMSLNGPAAYGLPEVTSRVDMIRTEPDHRVTERFIVPGEKILKVREIVPLFHKDLGLAPHFTWRRVPIK